MAQASCGVHELYPQKDLKLSVGGQNAGSISLPGGNWVKGEAVGQATVEIDWRGKLKAQTAVIVTNDPWTDLQISPAETTINPGEAVEYEVTANRGGLLRMVGPEQGVQLAVGDANVAQVLDQLNVGGKQEGRTTVVARLGNLTAEATLNVVAGNEHSTRSRSRPDHYSATGRHPHRRRHVYLSRTRGNGAGGEGGACRSVRGPAGGGPRSA